MQTLEITNEITNKIKLSFPNYTLSDDFEENLQELLVKNLTKNDEKADDVNDFVKCFDKLLECQREKQKIQNHQKAINIREKSLRYINKVNEHLKCIKKIDLLSMDEYITVMNRDKVTETYKKLKNYFRLENSLVYDIIDWYYTDLNSKLSIFLNDGLTNSDIKKFEPLDIIISFLLDTIIPSYENYLKMLEMIKNIEKFTQTLIISYEEFNELSFNFKLKGLDMKKDIFLYGFEKGLHLGIYNDAKCSTSVISGYSSIMADNETLKTLEEFQEYIIKTYLI